MAVIGLIQTFTRFDIAVNHACLFVECVRTFSFWIAFHVYNCVFCDSITFFCCWMCMHIFCHQVFVFPLSTCVFLNTHAQRAGKNEPSKNASPYSPSLKNAEGIHGLRAVLPPNKPSHQSRSCVVTVLISTCLVENIIDLIWFDLISKH